MESRPGRAGPGALSSAAERRDVENTSVSSNDPSRSRFAATAELQARRANERATALQERLLRFVELGGTEHSLDVGTGAGAVALALAPHVHDVVGIDVVPELLEVARRRGARVENVSFVEGDAAKLPFKLGSFDLVVCSRLLHHVPRPELRGRGARPGHLARRADARDQPDRADRPAARHRARPASSSSGSVARRLFPTPTCARSSTPIGSCSFARSSSQAAACDQRLPRPGRVRG